MSEVTDLHILAKMSYGTTNDEDAFIIKDSKGKKYYTRFII